MESSPEKLISNSESVVELLGHWPNFHDATLHNFCYTRNSLGTIDVEMAIEYPVVTKEVDREGFFVISSKISVAIKAFDVKCERISMIIFPDIIFRLYLERVCDSPSISHIRFCIDSAIEGGLSFLCRRVEVIEAKTIKAE